MNFVCLFVFNVPPIAKIIWGHGIGQKSYPEKSEDGDRTHRPWFTRQLIYPLHDSVSYTIVRTHILKCIMYTYDSKIDENRYKQNI